jgi:hypothetical protein
MVIAELARADHQRHGGSREKFPRALQMFFELPLDLVKRCTGIEDHMDALAHPFEDDLGLLGVQKPTLLLGHHTVSITSAGADNSSDVDAHSSRLVAIVKIVYRASKQADTRKGSIGKACEKFSRMEKRKSDLDGDDFIAVGRVGAARRSLSG